MKKILPIILCVLLMLSPINAAAINENAGVEIKVIGDVKKGNTIEILVDVKNVERFYAGSIDYRFDNTMLEIISLEAGDITNSDESGKFQPNGSGGEVENSQGFAKYSFTFMGDFEGNKGSGNFVKFKAKVLRDDSLLIGKKTMEIKLVERTTDNDMVRMNNYFKGYGSDIFALSNMAKMYNLTNYDQGYNGLYDLNGDNIIDIYDLVVVSTTMK